MRERGREGEKEREGGREREGQREGGMMLILIYNKQTSGRESKLTMYTIII